jgi:3-methylfumaryl-CoA hydratase
MVSLFLYNAVIWNPHRIHFDESYTTQVEKHPGIVVDGPLQGDWLSQVVTEWIGDDGALVELEYSNRRAAYLGERLRAGGEVVEVDQSDGTVTLEIYIKNADDQVIAPGRAVVRLRD